MKYFGHSAFDISKPILIIIMGFAVIAYISGFRIMSLDNRDLSFFEKIWKVLISFYLLFALSALIYGATISVAELMQLVGKYKSHHISTPIVAQQ